MTADELNAAVALLIERNSVSDVLDAIQAHCLDRAGTMTERQNYMMAADLEKAAARIEVCRRYVERMGL